MEYDDTAITPGRKDYWDEFYDDYDGPLQRKQKTLQRKDAEAVPLLDHYEWFTSWDVLGERFWRHIERGWSSDPSRPVDEPARLLHIGCGNSNLADPITEEWSRETKQWARKNGRQLISSSVEVLNMDICEKLVHRLKQVFPRRFYVVGDGCAMVTDSQTTDGDAERMKKKGRTAASIANAEGQLLKWASERDGDSLLSVNPSSVDIVLDKGTLDALLSAFPGETNPNAELLFQQVLLALRPGGIMLLITINSKEVISPYVFGASVEPLAEDMDDDRGLGLGRSFELVCSEVLDVEGQFEDSDDPATAALRVETLGQRYTVYTFRCKVG